MRSTCGSLLVLLPCLFGAVPVRAQAVLVPDAILHGGFPVPRDARGISVATSADGHTAIVGAMRGGARIFVHGESGWILDHEIRAASVRDEADSAVAISADGNEVLVSEPGDRAGGVVSVLVRRDDAWELDAELRAPDAARGDRFGAALAVSADGSTVLVGAPSDDVAENDAGSARVFVRDGSWSQVAMLVADDGARLDGLGTSVAMSSDGTVMLVGAPRDDVDGEQDAGSVHAFVRTVDGWAEESRASGRARGDLYGWALAISADGTVALVGAPGLDDGPFRDAGSVDVRVRTATGWRSDAEIGSVEAMRRLGAAVALSGDGSRGLVAARVAGQSVVRLVTRTAGSAAMHSGVDAPDLGLDPAVAMSTDGRHAVIGTPGDEIDDARHAGSAHAFLVADGDDVAPSAWAPTTEPMVGPRFRAGVYEGRTPEQEAEIADATTALLVVGGIGCGAGAITLIAGLLVGIGDAFSSAGGSSSSAPMLIGGGSVAGLGLLSFAAAGIVSTQATRGGLHPQLVLAPTEGGAYGGVTLRF